MKLLQAAMYNNHICTKFVNTRGSFDPEMWTQRSSSVVERWEGGAGAGADARKKSQIYFRFVLKSLHG